MKESKRIIWSDDIGNIEDWEDEDGNPMTYEQAEELNNEYLEDERMNLDIPTENEIICIGDIGLWNGRRKGYQLIGHNVRNILQSRMNCLSYNEFYDDGKNICQCEAHHDGTNIYLYRILKGKNHDEQVANAEKLFSKPLTNQRIAAFTKSIRPLVAAVYGW